jgi:hypothetical protein
MKRQSIVAILAAASALALSTALAPPAHAIGFSIFGSYWDPDEANDVGGGGLEVSFPLSPRWEIDLRGSYYEELDPKPLQVLADTDSPFRNRGFELTPIELGARFDFRPDAPVRPYIGGGGSYYIVDSHFGNVDDESGWYGLLGLGFGDKQGASFFVEGQYRWVEATVKEDPDHPFDFPGFERTKINLDGWAFNAGVSWRF